MKYRIVLAEDDPGFREIPIRMVEPGPGKVPPAGMEAVASKTTGRQIFGADGPEMPAGIQQPVAEIEGK